MALTACLLLCGLALFAYYAKIANEPVADFQRQVAPVADKLLPRFIVHVLPPGMAGLLLAALLAGAMCSLSSAINSIASVISNDFLLRFRPQRPGCGLHTERWISLLAGLTATLAALV